MKLADKYPIYRSDIPEGERVITPAITDKVYRELPSGERTRIDNMFERYQREEGIKGLGRTGFLEIIACVGIAMEFVAERVG